MDKLTYPDALPADGKGVTRRLTIHLNFGEEGGAATYRVLMGEATLPVSYQYDTRQRPAFITGYFIDGIDKVFSTWAEVAGYWPTFLKDRQKDDND